MSEAARKTSIHLYVEHLRNIRCLSILGSLQTVPTKDTKATLSQDGTALSLTHEGETVAVQLPVKVPGKRNAATIHVPAAKTTDISFRLQLDERPGSAGGFLSNGEQPEDFVPWTARALTSTTEVNCGKCENTKFVPRGRATLWKDLPSEGWAEMMEFWHCHKPDVPDNHDHAGGARGFSADSKLALYPGMGMVSPIEILFTREDCQNIEIGSDNTLTCSSCSSPLGTLDPETTGFRLRKPYLSISTFPSAPATSYPLEQWLSCLLLTAMDTQGVRKFTIRSSSSSASSEPTNNQDDLLKIWIFTPDLSISSSSLPQPPTTTSDEPSPLSLPPAIRVMKIFYRLAPPTSTASSNDKGNGSQPLTRSALGANAEEDLMLPFGEATALEKTLQRSEDLLPRRSEARVFSPPNTAEKQGETEEWRIGLLRRF